jgi:iron complex outermembrane receptor protein
VSGLAITAGLGFTKARYDEFKDGGGKGIHYDGNKLTNAPEIEYNLAVDYRKQLGQAGGIVLHGDLIYRDEYFTHANNNRQTHFVEAYHLLNTRTGFETTGGTWSLFLGIQNVTDKLYTRAKGVGFLGTPFVWFGLPRTYTLQLSYNFSN